MKKPLFIAELSINHLGMLNVAKQMIKAAKAAGANYVKLKMKNVKKYYKNDDKKWRNFSFIDYRNSLELEKEDFLEIDKFCKEIGIGWYATVHDDESLDFIQQFDVPFFKVASMDSAREDFVEEVMHLCKAQNKPFIISLGGKDNDFTQRLVDRVTKADIRCYILHTVSEYPTPIGRSNINYISYLKKNFETDKIRIGYSGHEEGFSPTLLASSLGAEMIERHFALDREVKIHHIKAALTPEEFGQMTNTIGELLVEQETKAAQFNKKELEFLKDRVYA